MIVATAIGAERQLRGIYDHTDRLGKTGPGWDGHIQGVAAELAVAKARGLYWDAHLTSYKDADVGDNVEVRSTHHRRGRLIIKPNDNPGRIYVLVVGTAPKLDIAGWTFGADVMIDDNWKAVITERPEPCWWVSQHQLQPWETMPGVRVDSPAVGP